MAIQGRMQDPGVVGGDANPQKGDQLNVFVFFLKNLLKLKEFGRGGGAPGVPPLTSAAGIGMLNSVLATVYHTEQVSMASTVIWSATECNIKFYYQLPT